MREICKTCKHLQLKERGSFLDKDGKPTPHFDHWCPVLGVWRPEENRACQAYEGPKMKERKVIEKRIKRPWDHSDWDPKLGIRRNRRA